MIKKIPSDQHMPGKYIHDLSCGWMSHPFLLNQFNITKPEEIETIVTAGIREVYIDTVKGIDVKDAPTETEIRKIVEQGTPFTLGITDHAL